MQLALSFKHKKPRKTSRFCINDDFRFCVTSRALHKNSLEVIEEGAFSGLPNLEFL